MAPGLRGIWENQNTTARRRPDSDAISPLASLGANPARHLHQPCSIGPDYLGPPHYSVRRPYETTSLLLHNPFRLQTCQNRTQHPIHIEIGHRPFLPKAAMPHFTVGDDVRSLILKNPQSAICRHESKSVGVVAYVVDVGRGCCSTNQFYVQCNQ